MTAPGAARSGEAGRVDLHLHSTASDGTLPPADVVRYAAEAGLTGVALTDHDTTAGVDEAERAAAELGLRFMPAAELSATEPGTSVHLLAFGFDRADGNLQAFLGRYDVDRRRRAREIVERLRALDLEVTYEDVEAQTGAAAPTRAHVARALVACGLVSDDHEAFRRYLSRERPAFVEKRDVAPRRVFEVVHEAGGVVCLAHPGRVHGVDDVRRWAQEGLDGVEVLHPANSASVRSRLNAVAAELRLLRCGGSDWHGPGKRRGGPGREPVPERWLDEIVARSGVGRATR